MKFTTKASRDTRRAREIARSTHLRRRFFGCDQLEDRVVPAALFLNGSNLDETFTLNLAANGGMSWTYANSSISIGATIPAGSYDSIVISGGGGRNQTYVYGTNLPVYIYDSGFADYDYIGSHTAGVSNIIAPVTCANASGPDSQIVIDDSGNASVTRFATVTNNSVTGLANAAIYFNQNQISALSFFTGAGVSDFFINDTPDNNNLHPFTSISNSNGGSIQAYVLGTTGPLSFGGAGSGSGGIGVAIGMDEYGHSHTTSAIHGNIYLNSVVNGSESLNINNQASGAGQTVDIYKDSITGIAPATIYFTPNDPGTNDNLQNLYITGANGNSTYNLHDTGAPNTQIETGSGFDTVNVLQTHGFLNLVNDGIFDTIHVGSGGSMAGITADLVLPAGRAQVFLDNSSETFARTATLGVDSFGYETITGLTSATINFPNVAPSGETNNYGPFLAILGGNAASRYYINNTNNAFSSTNVYTGTGRDLVFVAATTGPLFLGNQGGGDSIFVGSGGSMAGIQGSVGINPVGDDGLYLDDTGDATGRDITMGTGHTHGWIDGIAPAEISWNTTATSSGGVTYVEVKTGSGNNAITVNDTNLLLRGTVLSTGAGNNTVNVDRTTGDLYLKNRGGNAAYVVGRDPAYTTGDVSSNTGLINIDNGGVVDLTVDDSADSSAARIVTLSNYTLTGLSPAPISFGANHVSRVTIKGGNLGNTYNITDNATDASTHTFITTGSGNDVINVGGASNTLDAIVGSLSVSNGGGTDTLNMNDQGSTANNAYSLGANSFARTGTGAVDWTGVNTVNLIGGSGNDTYTLTEIPGAGVSITDAGGYDTLVGPDATSAWSITGTNVFSVGGDTFTFAESLVGGAGNDTFAFQPGGQITGTLNGGSGGYDTIDDSALSDQINLVLSNSTISGVGAGFANIENVIGGTNTGNQLYGPNTDNTFWLNGTNSGYFGNFNFSNFPNLTGGSGNEDFVFFDGTTITGSIDGGGGASNGIEEYATSTPTSVTPSTGQISRLGGTFTGLQWVTASHTAGGTINGADTPNTFGITVQDGVTLGGLSCFLFNKLAGGAGNDVFQFVDGLSFAGSIDGGGGFNTLDYSAVTTPVVTKLTTNTSSGIGGTFANIQNEIGGTNTGNQLTGPNSDNVFWLSGTNGGNVGNFNFINFPNLIGGPKNDNFFIYDNSNVTGSIDGGGGASNGIEQDGSSTPVNVNFSTSQVSNVGGTFSHLQWLSASNFAGGTVTGAPGGSKFSITAPNTVSLGGVSLYGFNNLVGGAGNDLFKFSAGVSFIGSIDGGGGTNTIDQSAYTTTITADYTTGTITGVGGTFANIGVVKGGTAANTLKGPAANANFTITATNAGSINGVATYSNFGTLIGGAGNDSFKFATTGALNGAIDGGGGSNTLDYSLYTTKITVNLATNIVPRITSPVVNIQRALGGTNTTNSIIGPDTGAVFTITGANSGKTDGGFSFSGFGNIVAGAGNDTVAFANAGSLTGTINGGGGSNTIDESAKKTSVLAKPSTGTISNVASYTNFLVLIGSSTVSSVLTGGPTSTIFYINGANSGTVGSTSFSNFGNFAGDIGNDIFRFAAGASINGGIDGGAGINTIDQVAITTPITANLTTMGITGLGGAFTNIQTLLGGTGGNTLLGPAASSTFNITGTNAGNVAGITFSKYGTLVGGAGDDVFKLGPASLLSGTVKGGTGSNTLDYTAYTNQVVVNLTTGLATRVTIPFASIQKVIGGTNALNQITGPVNSTVFNVTGANAGNVAGLTFSNFAKLIGGAGNDTFKFSDGASLTNTVDGGAGSNVIDLSAYTTPVVANLTTSAITGLAVPYLHISALKGGTGSNTLNGPTAASTYNISATNTGTVGAITFNRFDTIIGGANSDAFVFGPTGSISGKIDGGGGTNTFDYSAITTQVNVNLGTAVASRVVNPYVNITKFIGGSFAGNQITGPAAGATFNVTGANQGSVAGTTFSGFGRLIGGAGNDTFVMANGATLTSGVDGGAGSNWLDYGLYTTGVNVNLATGTATGFGATLANIQKVRGGSGNDTLTGNSPGNVLIGGAGNDTLIGGTGRSVLIGGTGTDTITGGSGDDIVIGGSTTFDNNFAALDSILNEWKSTTDSYATRVNFLKNGGGANGTNVLTLGTTVIDDLATNVLTGGAGNDWFFKGTKDNVTDLQAGEQVN